jgi:hypothetical protein
VAARAAGDAMSARAASRLGWSTWVVCVAVAGFTLTLSILSVGVEPRSGLGDTPSGGDVVTAGVYFFAVAAFATVGAFVIWRRPGNEIGWVFLAIGLVVSIRVGAAQYAEYSLLVRPGSLPGGRVAVSLGEAVSTSMFALLGLALLLFPDGRLPSRRWRKVLWILGAAALLGMAGLGFRPGHFVDSESFDTFSNPLGVGSDPEPFDALGGLAWLLVTVGVFACGLAMVRRMRRAHGIERLQLKWIAFAASLLAVGFLVISITFFAELSGATIDPLRTGVLGLGFCAIPIAAGIAILRYRLYDIDVVINRTLVYGALTATLAAAYLGSVLLLQVALRPLTEESNLAIAGSTLAVAALFRPARARIQAGVDRRFFRRKYDAARTLELFGARLRDEVDLDVLGGELRQVVMHTMQPASVSLWLRAPESS